MTFVTRTSRLSISAKSEPESGRLSGSNPGPLHNEIDVFPLEGATQAIYTVPHSSSLLNSQTAILLTPAIVGLFGYTDLPTGFRDRYTMVNVDLNFPQFIQDLVTIHEYYSPSVLECDHVSY